MEQTIFKSENPLSDKKHYSHLFPLDLSIPVVLSDLNEKHCLNIRILYDNPPKLAKTFKLSFKIAMNDEIHQHLTDWLEAKLTFIPTGIDAASTSTLNVKKKKFFNFGFRSRVKTN